MSNLESLKEIISDLAESPEMTSSLGKRAAELTGEFMVGATPDQITALKAWLLGRLEMSTADKKARVKLSYQSRRTYILQSALDRVEGRPTRVDDEWD